MSLNSIFSAANISSSGMAAERMRMDIISQNVANASATRTTDGGPYRRRQVVFATAMNDLAMSNRPGKELGGVRISGIEEDQSDFKLIHQPGHPDANEEGYVSMPNVDTAIEMVDLITASRAYEANLKVLENYREMAQRALALLRDS
ncbi:MAG: flagellar basal body rod protein FlgC [bacterium]|nr:flagellar basal body rod protein FlgC [bacterium]